MSNGPNAVELVHHSVIERQLMVALSDKSKVAILVTEKDLDMIIAGLVKLTRHNYPGPEWSELKASLEQLNCLLSPEKKKVFRRHKYRKEMEDQIRRQRRLLSHNPCISTSETEMKLTNMNSTETKTELPWKFMRIPPASREDHGWRMVAKIGAYFMLAAPKKAALASWDHEKNGAYMEEACNNYDTLRTRLEAVEKANGELVGNTSHLRSTEGRGMIKFTVEILRRIWGQRWCHHEYQKPPAYFKAKKTPFTNWHNI